MTASETGCISAHYQNMVIECEEVCAFATPADNKQSAVIWAEKKDGTPVLQGSACIGPNHHPGTQIQAAASHPETHIDEDTNEINTGRHIPENG